MYEYIYMYMCIHTCIYTTILGSRKTPLLALLETSSIEENSSSCPDNATKEDLTDSLGRRRPRMHSPRSNLSALTADGALSSEIGKRQCERGRILSGPNSG